MCPAPLLAFLSCLVLPCLTLPYLTLPYLELPSVTLPCHTMHAMPHHAMSCHVLIVSLLSSPIIQALLNNSNNSSRNVLQSDQYLHRVGRAGRFGTKGLAISFISTPEVKQPSTLMHTHTHSHTYYSHGKPKRDLHTSTCHV